ncbi:MAG TPA: hypothetical protein VF375_05770, partial [Candidatus Limnocylindrales bacterium]
MTQSGDPSFGWDNGIEVAEGLGVEPGQSPREVAVDAPGASKTYTYLVPARLARIEDGEAVLVEFGKSRQALGVVLGPARGEVPAEAKPILARVRADGPLLPRLTLDFARWISEEYLAPPAATLRSMLPPGMLEKLELIAERAPVVAGADEAFGAVLGAAPVDREEAALLERLDGGPRPVRDLEGGDGRAPTLRRLRSMASRGLVRMEWTLTATVGPRYERWLRLSDEGRAAVGRGSGGAALAVAPVSFSGAGAAPAAVVGSGGAAPAPVSLSGAGGAPAVAPVSLSGAGAAPAVAPVSLSGAGAAPAAAPAVAPLGAPAPAPAPRRAPRLGPRQQAMLAELAAVSAAGLSAADAAGRHGSGTATGLIRRGLVEADVRERPRSPIARRK